MVNLSAVVFCLVSGLVLSLSNLESPSNYHDTPYLAEKISYSAMPSLQVSQGIPMGGMRIIIPDGGFPYVFGDSTAEVQVPDDASGDEENDGHNDGEDLPGADVNDQASGGASDLLIEV